MTSQIHLKVLTPEKVLLDVLNVSRLKLRLADGGMIGILPSHAPLIAQTSADSLFYSDKTGDHEARLQSGILHVDFSSVVILTVETACASSKSPGAELSPYEQAMESFCKQLFLLEGMVDGEET